MKVVVDTNVLIDALNDNLSVTWKILELAHKGDVQFFASDKIVKEYKLLRVLKKKCGWIWDFRYLSSFSNNILLVYANNSLCFIQSITSFIQVTNVMT